MSDLHPVVHPLELAVTEGIVDESTVTQLRGTLTRLLSWMETGLPERETELEHEEPEAVTYTRQNLHDWPDSRARRLVRVLEDLNRPANRVLGRFVFLHRVVGPLVHSHRELRFLPWHRLMVFKLEQIIRAHAEGGDLHIPYWTWWHEAPVTTGGARRRGVPAIWADFRPTVLGPSETDTRDAGFQRVWTDLQDASLRAAFSTVMRNGSTPSASQMLGHLRANLAAVANVTVTRARTRAQLLEGSGLPSRAGVRSTLRKTRFTDSGTTTGFSNSLEHDGGHDMTHVWVGGTMGDPAVSPADPLFYFHHCEVDRLWQIWQETHSSTGPRVTGAELPPWSESISDVSTIGGRVLPFAFENKRVDDPR